ncbi:MAG: CHC2 zinc finger domain-containing protein [Peptostreptococcaceae bacterium]
MKTLEDIDLKKLIEDETGQRFKQGYIPCPFHGEKTGSLAVKYNSDYNKEKFKCFGCGASGDALDFVMKHKGLDWKKAREYLGLENKKSDKEIAMDKIKSRIAWDIENQEYKKGYKLVGLFEFTNDKNEIIYYKAKFLKPNNKKCSSYYRFEGDKVINNREGITEVPYNLYNTLQAIQDSKTIIFVEGEKDANTINSIVKKYRYCTTSIKGCKDLSILKRSKIRQIYVIGDTGEAGEFYVNKIKEEFRSITDSFKIINLKGIKALGDNKDVTDWIEAGHTTDDLFRAFDRSLDINSPYELQQDRNGIYKKYEKKDIWYRVSLTDFNLIEATRINFVDEEQEGIRLKFRSCTGEIIERIGPSSVFDDVRSFKNFLGTLDLAFKGKVDELTDLKSWINKYWALDNETVYSGVKFLESNGKMQLVTSDGAITTTNIDTNITTNSNLKVNLSEIDLITKEELAALWENIFKFAKADKSIPIIGTILNNFLTFHNRECGKHLHHLLIVGESGSGKSTVLKNVVKEILNIDTNPGAIGGASKFAIVKAFSDGNYTLLYDEFKPSMIDKYKWLNISDVLRNAYERTPIPRGDKTFNVREFALTRPVVIAGEESYPNSEKALIDRSCIVYLSRNERDGKNTEAMKWLINNKSILNKLGRSIIQVALEMPLEEYRLLYSMAEAKYIKFGERPLETATNIDMGIELFNILLRKHNLKELTGYEAYIEANILEEVLEGGQSVKSTVERMIVLYNEMIEDGRANDPESVVCYRNNKLGIKTSEMLNQIHNFINVVGSAEVTPLKLKDFRKQAIKAGYIKLSDKQFYGRINNKNIRMDEYDIDKMRALNIPSIIENELEQVPIEDNVRNIFDAM